MSYHQNPQDQKKKGFNPYSTNLPIEGNEQYNYSSPQQTGIPMHASQQYQHSHQSQPIHPSQPSSGQYYQSLDHGRARAAGDGRGESSQSYQSQPQNQLPSYRPSNPQYASPPMSQQQVNSTLPIQTFNPYANQQSSQSHSSLGAVRIPSNLEGFSTSPTSTSPTNPSANLFHSPAAQLGLQFGSQALNAGQEYVSKNISRFITFEQIKTFYAVDDVYCCKKLFLLFFPFQHKNWDRKRAQIVGDVQQEFLLPIEDINAPDLYIPTMAVVTYVLLVAIFNGIKGKFQSDQLGMSFSRALVFIITELMVTKLINYIFSMDISLGVLDILSFTGYGFVGLIMTLLASIAFGKLAQNIVFAYTGLAIVFFLLRSLRQIFVPDNVSVNIAQRRRRIYFLFGISILQVLCSYFLLI